MRRFSLLKTATLFAAVSLFVNPASATPLRLEYCVTDLGGGVYRYDFKFINDNNDGTWAAGQSFRWFVLGDCAGPCTSPLTGFVGDVPSLLAGGGPYTGFGNTGGGHNGPDLQGVLIDWIPTGVGDSFTFSGTSTANLAQGQLAWSNVTNGSTNPGVRGNFEIAHRCICQLDIGFQGPGPALLSVCGGDLSTGTTAALEVTGAKPSAAGYLVVDPVHTPFPIFGGTLVGFSGFPLSSNASGGLSLTVPGGGGPMDVYVQFIYLDLSLTQGLGFTNGVKIQVLP